MLRIISFMQINPKSFNLLALYNELNKFLFNSALPKIPVSFKKLPKGIAGLTQIKTIKTGNNIRFGVTIPDTLTIDISPRSYSLEVLKGVLAHEMIHAEILLSGDIKTFHGGEFERRRRELERKAGFKIPIDHKSDESEFAEDDKKQTGVLLLYHTDRINIILIPAKSVLSVADKLEKNIKSNMSLNFSPKIIRAKFGAATTHYPSIYKITNSFNPDRFYKSNIYKITSQQADGVKFDKLLFDFINQS